MYDIVEIDLYCCFSLSNRGCKYIKKSIGDIGEPCGMPVSIDDISSLSLSKAREICRFDMKSFVHAIILSAMPSDRIVLNNLALETLSKAPLTSSIRLVDFNLCDCAFCTSCTRHMTASIAEHCFQPPICSLFRRSCFST